MKNEMDVTPEQRSTIAGPIVVETHMHNHLAEGISSASGRNLVRATNVIVLAYIIAIAGAELLALFVGVLASLACHAILILLLLSHAIVAGQSPYRRILPVLALAPLLRILSLTIPLREVPEIYWYAMIGTPLLLAVMLAARLLDLSWSRMGFSRPAWRSQVLMLLSGLPLSIIAFLLAQPEPMMASFSWGEFAIGALILLVFTGFVEELIFRGLLQQVASEPFGRSSILVSTALFAIMYVGSLSPSYILFIALVGLLFGWHANRTGSLWGVVLAHGFLNIGMLLVWPSLVAWLGIQVSQQLSALAQLGLWLLVIAGAGFLAWRRLQRPRYSRAAPMTLVTPGGDALEQPTQLATDHNGARATDQAEYETPSELVASRVGQLSISAEIEQAMERLGAQRIADLRGLSEELGRFYQAQLSKKNEQIAALRQSVEGAERERDASDAQLQELKHICSGYISDLQALREPSTNTDSTNTAL
jgi:membrane protease YdiL (CAAX protease family)